MSDYLDAGNQDRIYSEHGDCLDLLDEEFDYDKASARILGRDIGRLLTASSRAIVERVLLQGIPDSRAETLAAVMVRNNATFHGDYDLALAMLAELATGISEA